MAEIVAVDTAVVAGGQQSPEDRVNMAMLDSTGPFDDHFGGRLIALCEEHGVQHRRDTIHSCWSDAAGAVEAGLDMSTACSVSASTSRTATSAPTWTASGTSRSCWRSPCRPT